MQNKEKNAKARLPTGAEVNGKQVAKKRGLKMCHGCRMYVKHNSKTRPTKYPKELLQEKLRSLHDVRC